MIDLRPIARSEAAAALAVIDAGFREIWSLSVEDVRAMYDALEDLDEPAVYYPEHGGVFLVLEDTGRIIGTGAIARLAPETAELRRLWLLSAYRGKGLGRRLVESLLVFARWNDYRSVRLEVATPELQQPALGLYRRLGFRAIPPYRDGATALAMERQL